MPLFEKGGAYCFAHVGRYIGMSVGRSVSSIQCAFLVDCSLLTTKPRSFIQIWVYTKGGVNQERVGIQ